MRLRLRLGRALSCAGCIKLGEIQYLASVVVDDSMICNVLSLISNCLLATAKLSSNTQDPEVSLRRLTRCAPIVLPLSSSLLSPHPQTSPLEFLAFPFPDKL